MIGLRLSLSLPLNIRLRAPQLRLRIIMHLLILLLLRSRSPVIAAPTPPAAPNIPQTMSVTNVFHHQNSPNLERIKWLTLTMHPILNPVSQIRQLPLRLRRLPRRVLLLSPAFLRSAEPTSPPRASLAEPIVWSYWPWVRRGSSVETPPEEETFTGPSLPIVLGGRGG